MQYLTTTLGIGRGWRGGSSCMISSTEEKVKSYLMSKGMQPLPIDQSLETKPNLSFSEANGCKVFVKIPSREELENRNGILSLILRATSFTRTADKVYVALPRTYAPIIDGAIIQEEGLGLIIHDEKTINEAITPKSFEHQASSKSQENLDVAHKIEQLGSRIGQLEQTVQILKSQISQLKSIRPLAETSKTESVRDGLPSFFRDNAWLDILSKRGREPERYVS
jgi:hypothetical protein